MGKFRITCKTHDENEVITRVGIGDKTYAVQTIVDWINNKEHSFYTEENGNKAEVYAKQHPTSNRWFLTTKPDGIDENNLDFLPNC